jgi:hypothetical protein
MEATIVQPGAAPSIYTTGDRHGHGDHHNHRGFDAVEARADFRSLTAEVERFGVANGDRITSGTLGTSDRIKDGLAITGDRINTAASSLAAGQCRTDSLVQAGFGDTSDRICASTKDITGSLGAGFTAAALAACKTSDEVAAVYAALQKQVSDAATATVVGFKDAQATAYQIEGRTALDAAKNVATLGLQATTNANALSVEATKNFYALSVEATKNASAAQLEAQKNASAIAAQVAECCCELKMLVTAEGVSSRALANEIEARRVSNELQRLQTQVLVLTGGVIGSGARAAG